MSVSEAFRTWFLQPLVKKMSALSDAIAAVATEVAADKAALADAVTRITAFQQAQSDKIDALTAQLAAGGVDQATLDQLSAIKDDATSIHAVVDGLDAAPAS